MTTYDGASDDDRRLWHSYVYLARQHAITSGGKAIAPAIVDDASHLVHDSLREALQTVLFSSFVLEYRLKRVHIEMGRPPKQTTLSPLFDGFWKALRNVDRLDGAGKCAPPTQWASLAPRLKRLITLRNQMAHANYVNVLKFLGQKDPPRQARDHYNDVVEAIMLINLGTGYETAPFDEVEKYFAPLRVVDVA